MRYTFFKIKNFKGIVDVRLDFDAKPQSNIYTLVGLNESGKTTVLEAIDFLKPSIIEKVEKSVVQELLGYSVKDPRDLIPMGQRDNFNGDIEIEAGFQLDAEDLAKISAFLKSIDMEFVDGLDKFSVSKKFTFKDSELQDPSASSYWSDFTPKVRRFATNKLGRRRLSANSQLLTSNGNTGPDWLNLIRFTKTLLPNQWCGFRARSL